MADTKASAFSGIGTWTALASDDLFPFINVSAVAAAKNSIATTAELVTGLKTHGLAGLTTNTFSGVNKFEAGAESYIGAATNMTILGFSAGASASAIAGDVVAIGFQAAYDVSGSCTYMTAMGRHALAHGTGDNCVAIGHAPSQYARSNNNAIAIGYLAGRNTLQDATFNAFSAISIGAFANEKGTHHQYSVAIGELAGNIAVSNIKAVNIGYGCVQVATLADESVVVGQQAAGAATTCYRSVLLGNQAGYSLNRDHSLCIESNPTYNNGTSSLIYGEFDNRVLVLNATATIANSSAVSKSALLLNGSIFTGGTGTTNFAHFTIKPTSATAATTLSTAGTALHINTPSGFTGNMIDARLDGSDSFKFRVDYLGNVYIRDDHGFVSAGTGAWIIKNGGSDSLVCGSTYLSSTTSAFTIGTPFGPGTTGSITITADATHVTAFKEGANAQAVRIYGTTTGSKYLNLAHNGTNAVISASSGDVHISNLPTSNPGAGILWNNSGTPAIGT